MAHTTRRADPRAAKARDMSRSVLPSTGRRGARAELTTIRRRHRRAIKMRSGRIAGIPCLCAELDDASPLADCPRCDVDPVLHAEYPISDHLMAVSDRRLRDKLAPLLRWGAHQVEGREADAAEAHLRSVLPAGLIGHHAMLHLRIAQVVADPQSDEDDRWAYEAYRARRSADRFGALVLVAETALNQSLIAMFHDVVKRHALRSERVRPVRFGSPDVPAYASVEIQDRRDLAPRGFQERASGSTNVPVADRKVWWWRPLRGHVDVHEWATAYLRCGHDQAVDRMTNELLRMLRLRVVAPGQ